MILTKLVRRQLTIFAILAVIGMSAAAISYLRVPTMLGIGRYSVTVELPDARRPVSERERDLSRRHHRSGQVGASVSGSGTRRIIFGECGSRSLQRAQSSGAKRVGNRRAIRRHATEHRGRTLSDRRRRDRPRRCHDPDRDRTGPRSGAGDARIRTAGQVAIGDRRVRGSFRRQGRGSGSSAGFDHFVRRSDVRCHNAGYDARTAVGSAPADTGGDGRSDSPVGVPVSLNSVGQLEVADGSVRNILETGPGFATEADLLFQEGLKPTLPVLLANFTSTAQVALTYNAGLEQVLVILPPLVAAQETVVQRGQVDGAANVNFHLQAQDPAACSTGYLPADQRRDPTQTSVPDTPADLYCKVPQNSVFAVRGSRNIPCMEVPGKRAPSPEICRSPEAYVPSGTNAPGELYTGPDGVDYQHTELAPADSGPGEGEPWQQLLTPTNR